MDEGFSVRKDPASLDLPGVINLKLLLAQQISMDFY